MTTEEKKRKAFWATVVDPNAPIRNRYKFGKWKVTKAGSLTHERGYSIPFNRLEENWIEHLDSKAWIDWNEFIPAYLQALKNKGVKDLNLHFYH
jgi:hypothetical protein